MNQRAFHYLEDQQTKLTPYTESQFNIPEHVQGGSNKGSNFDLVEEEALHLWITSRMKLIAAAARNSKHNAKLQSSEPSFSLPYNQLQRIISQINHYSQNLKWTMNINDDCVLERNGNVLFCYSESSGNDCQTSFDQLHGTETNGTNIDASPSWTIVDSNYAPGLANKTALKRSDDFVNPLEIFLTIRAIPETDSLILRPVVTGNRIDANKGGLASPASSYKKKDFTPPWRTGRSPVKIKDFLRSQKVPLHQRDSVLLLCHYHHHITSSNTHLGFKSESKTTHNDGKDAVVAIFIPTVSNRTNERTDKKDFGGEWYVSATYQTVNNISSHTDGNERDVFEKTTGRRNIQCIRLMCS